MRALGHECVGQYTTMHTIHHLYNIVYRFYAMLIDCEQFSVAELNENKSTDVSMSCPFRLFQQWVYKLHWYMELCSVSLSVLYVVLYTYGCYRLTRPKRSSSSRD